MSADLPFIEYGGRIVAIAGRTRCYFAVRVPLEQIDIAHREFAHLDPHVG